MRLKGGLTTDGSQLGTFVIRGSFSRRQTSQGSGMFRAQRRLFRQRQACPVRILPLGLVVVFHFPLDPFRCVLSTEARAFQGEQVTATFDMNLGDPTGRHPSAAVVAGPTRPCNVRTGRWRQGDIAGPAEDPENGRPHIRQPLDN